jgi:hypothetical protein
MSCVSGTCVSLSSALCFAVCSVSNLAVIRGEVGLYGQKQRRLQRRSSRMCGLVSAK